MSQRAIEIVLNGENVKTFCPQDALLVAAAHASRDCWRDIRFALDTILLIKTPLIDKSELLAFARKQGLSRILNITLELSYRLFDEPECQPGEIDEITLKCVENIYQRIISGNDCDEVEQFKLQLAIRETWVSKIRYVLARFIIPHESDWELNLPQRLFFLYFILKPLKTLALAGSKIFTHFLKCFA
jgi:hypothetical protein